MYENSICFIFSSVCDIVSVFYWTLLICMWCRCSCNLHFSRDFILGTFSCTIDHSCIFLGEVSIYLFIELRILCPYSWYKCFADRCMMNIYSQFVACLFSFFFFLTEQVSVFFEVHFISWVTFGSCILSSKKFLQNCLKLTKMFLQNILYSFSFYSFISDPFLVNCFISCEMEGLGFIVSWKNVQLL